LFRLVYSGLVGTIVPPAVGYLALVLLQSQQGLTINQGGTGDGI
jgi:hypothetical protein